MLADEKKILPDSGTPRLPKSNWDAAQLGIYLGVGALLLLWVLRGAAIMLGFFLEFILPIPVCFRARSNLILLSLIPNIVVNGFFAFAIAPRSGYWPGWRYGWKDALWPLGFGAAASLIVSGIFILRRRAELK